MHVLWWQFLCKEEQKARFGLNWWRHRKQVWTSRLRSLSHCLGFPWKRKLRGVWHKVFVRLSGFVTHFEATNITSQMMRLSQFPSQKTCSKCLPVLLCRELECGVHLRQWFLECEDSIREMLCVCNQTSPVFPARSLWQLKKKVFIECYGLLLRWYLRKAKLWYAPLNVCQLLLVNRGCFWLSQSSKFKTNPLELQSPFFIHSE